MKTHIDIIEDFDPSVVERLTELSQRHDFVIFEDRKFADIGEFPYPIGKLSFING
jgi:orotidine-5'-phosphate decarboxylase